MTGGPRARRASTAGVMDVDSIHKGLARLRTGQVRAALEIEPLNLALQADDSRTQIWRQYRQLLSALGGPVSLYTLSKPSTRTASAVPDPGPSGLLAADQAFQSQLVTSHRIQSQRHVIVIAGDDASPARAGIRRLGPYQMPTGPGRGVDLDQRCQALVGAMGRLGLACTRVDDGGWFALLQSCTGGRSGRRPPNFASWLAPDHLLVAAHELRVDRHFARSLVISGFPRRVAMGWLAPLVLTPPCTLRMVEHIYPVPKLASLAHLRRRIRNFETSLQVDHLRGQRPDRGTQTALGDALELEERVLLEEERLFRLAIAVTLEADSKEQLNDSWHLVLATLAEIGCGVTPLTNRQVDGWRATLPTGVDPIGWTRDMTASALATALPFIRAGLSASEGVLLGPSLVSRELVVADPFSAKNPNFNMVLLGTSGAGKSFTAKLLAARLALRGVRVRCIDPAGEYLQLTDLLGGGSMLLGSGPGSGLNVMGPFRDGPEEQPEAQRAARVLPVIEWLAAGRGGAGRLGDEQTERLEQAVLDLLREAPRQAALGDLVATLDRSGAPQLAARLRHYTEGVDRGFFDGGSTWGLPDFATICLRQLQRDREHLLAALMQTVLVHLESDLTGAAGIPHLLVVDEAEVLLSSPPAATALEGLTRRLRKLGAGLLVISQVVEDFLGSPVGNVIIRNCHTKILLRQEEVAIPAIQQAFGLSPLECELLICADPGCGLALVGRERAAFAGAAPPEWTSALSTDAFGSESHMPAGRWQLS